MLSRTIAVTASLSAISVGVEKGVSKWIAVLTSNDCIIIIFCARNLKVKPAVFLSVSCHAYSGP